MHGTKGSRSSWNPERNIAVDQLPDRLPAAIRLRYESGLTYKEMGERLGVDMNQARSLEQKAFKKLRIPSRAKRFKEWKICTISRQNTTKNSE